MRTVKIVTDGETVEGSPDIARHLIGLGKARRAPADPPVDEQPPATEEPVKPSPKTRKKAEDAGPDPASA